MELDDAIFQELESFGKGSFSKWLWKTFGFSVWENSILSENEIILLGFFIL